MPLSISRLKKSASSSAVRAWVGVSQCPVVATICTPDRSDTSCSRRTSRPISAVVQSAIVSMPVAGDRAQDRLNDA